MLRPRQAEPATAQADPESALLLAVGRGDREGPLRELYHLYERRLYALGIYRLGDPGLAEELVQETFLRLWRTADRFDPQRGTARSFIFAIARRLAIDLWRRPSSRPFEPEPEERAEADPALDGLLLSLEVREALESLSDAHRQVLELAFQGDLTQAQIAARLGLSLGTVKSRTYHALRAFKRAATERGLHG
ncbi:MAG: sigma-70 family RNA polymerase sigma factor [Candidatus Dormibacteraeota bacterium]|nr:sigma-70 family RNA polymerase sigma factor [Candidatus Dormibacteraeota bacterium]